MAVSRGPHVRELFVGHQAAIDYDEKESKKALNFGKKHKAPLHPKLGAYKPKILSDDISGNIPLESQPPPEKTNRTSSEATGKVNKAFVIGDKDVPMLLEPSENIYSELNEQVRPQSSNVPNEQTTKNPLFSASPSRDPSPSEHRGNVYRESYPPRSLQRETIVEEIEGVVVPPPDYDEDEMTLDFDRDDSSGRDRGIYKEFAGEDFSRYLSDDDDYEYDHNAYTVRSQPPVSRKIYKQKKSKTEARRGDKPKKDSSKSLFKQNAKNSGKSTLRNYSVGDSKLGIGIDGSAKKQKASLRDGVQYETSYESFLQTRNGGPRWGSEESASSDSGDVIHGGKSSPFWKKLTLKLKKTGYNLNH